MSENIVMGWVLLGFGLGIGVAVLLGVATWGFMRWRDRREEDALNDRIAGIAERPHWYSHRDRGVLRVEDHPTDND